MLYYKKTFFLTSAEDFRWEKTNCLLKLVKEMLPYNIFKILSLLNLKYGIGRQNDIKS